MLLKFNDLGKLFKSTFKEWNKKDPFRQSAVIAYYSIFSIPGLLVLIISISGYFLGKENVYTNILTQIATTFGADTAQLLKSMLDNISQSKTTIWGSILGIITILIGATGVFVELQITLNAIWNVEVIPKKGILPILKARIFSFGLILAIAFLMIISLVISAGIATLSHWIEAYTSAFTILVFSLLNFVFSLAVISILFALMFKILPDAKIKWRHVWLGSLLTGILFTVGKWALSFYFSTIKPDSIYGAAGSIVLILLWVSYSSMILFFGAEFTAAYSKMYLPKVPPSEIAKVEILH